MRKNYPKQQSAKIWRTPSPSNHTELKSPRFLRPGLGRQDSNKNLKNYEANGKLNHSNSFKAKLQGIKAEANKLTNSESEKDMGKGNRQNGKKQISIDAGQDPNPYNYYYKCQSHPDFINKEQVRSPITSRNISKNEKNTSFQENELLSMSKTNPTLPTKYHENLRRFILENHKLKQQNQQLRKKYEQLTASKLRREKQREMLRKNTLSNSKLIPQKNIEKEQQQIQTLKTQNMKKEEQLQHFMNRYRKKKEELAEAQKKIKHIESECSKLQNEKKERKSFRCEKCEQYLQNLQDLNDKLEIVMLESGRKEAIINSLCTQIKNLQNQMKNLEKPKLYLKRVNSLMADTNQEVMSLRLWRLNRKYRQIMIEKKSSNSASKFSSDKKPNSQAASRGIKLPQK